MGTPSPGLLALALALTLAVTAGCGGDDAGPDAEAVMAETGIDPGVGAQNFRIGLNPPNGGTKGNALVTAEADEQVRVNIQLDAGGDETFPAEIRRGTCVALGDAAHELADVEVGRSQTLLEESMAEFRTNPYSIVVGGEGNGEYEACGKLLGDATGG